LDLYPTYHPTGEVQFLQKAWDLLSDDARASLQRAESNLNALSTVDLGPKRPFSVGECALLARLSGPRFAGQVAAAVSLVEVHSNSSKAAAVAKEVTAIKDSNQTGLSIEKFLEAPFAGKHPKPIKKSTKAAAAEAAVTASEAIAVVDLEEAKRLALAQEAEPGDPLRKCWLAYEWTRVPEARSINLAEILTARTDVAAEAVEVAAAEAVPPRRPPPRKLPPPWKLPPPRKLPPPWGAPRKPLSMRLVRRRPWRPSCRKILAAARAAWPRTPRRSSGGQRN
jgi:hypothetical protein